MRVALIISILGTSVLWLVPKANGQASPSARAEVPEIRTTATAHRTVPPDLATVTLQFTADGRTPRDAGLRLAARADSLRRALAALGLSRDSLVTSSNWYWWRGRIEVLPQSIRYVARTTIGPQGETRDAVQDTLYRAHDAIQVRIHDLSKVGAVLDSAMAHRITEISGVQFSATNVTAAREEALREATVAARRQAEIIAGASAAQLGRTLSLSTESDYRDREPFLVPSGYASTDSEVRGEPGTVVVQPSISVSITVYGRWELIAKP